MKTKIIIVAAAAALTAAAVAHSGHVKPVDGKCPLQAAISACK